MQEHFSCEMHQMLQIEPPLPALKDTKKSFSIFSLVFFVSII
jgi:hypothetical protein